MTAIIFGCKSKPEEEQVSIKVLTNFLGCEDGGIFESEPFLSTVQAAATTKQLVPAWHQIFLRGIGCNWLVCLACFYGMQGKDLVSKTVGIWWPMFAFTHLGLDHVISNMFYIPMAIFLGTPGLTVGNYIVKGIPHSRYAKSSRYVA